MRSCIRSNIVLAHPLPHTGFVDGAVGQRWERLLGAVRVFYSFAFTAYCFLYYYSVQDPSTIDLADHCMRALDSFFMPLIVLWLHADILLVSLGVGLVTAVVAVFVPVLSRPFFALTLGCTLAILGLGLGLLFEFNRLLIFNIYSVAQSP